MVNIEIDDTQFKQAIRDYLDATGKDIVYVLNRAGRNLAFKALKQTHRADRAAIEQLRQEVASEIFSKTGKRLKRPRTVYSPTTRAKLILLKKLWQSGTNPRSVYSSSAAIDEATLAMVSRRMSAAGFIASGWLPAVGAFSAATGVGRATDGVQVHGRSKGYGAIATDAKPEAEVANAAAGKTAGGAAALLRYAGPALAGAVSIVATDMQTFAEARMAETARRFTTG